MKRTSIGGECHEQQGDLTPIVAKELASDVPEINLIALRHGHHSAHSGYGAMADVLPGRVIPTGNSVGLAQRVLGRAFRGVIRRSGSQWYQRRNLLAETVAAKRWLVSSSQIFHFLYGENSYRYLGYLKKLSPRNHIVCTYHTPAKRFDEVVRNRRHLQFIDAAIAFTRDQTAHLSSLISPDRVFFVPHGVDVTYFRPPSQPRPDGDHLHCLFVGQHLRDFETLAAAVRVLEAADIRFSIVTREDRFHHFEGLNNVKLLSGLPDAELLALYQQTDVFVFPLLDATANCALQEAMACGLPVVGTDMPAVRDYVDDSCAVLTPKGKPDALADAIQSLKQNRNLLVRMGAASRERAEDVSLENIAERTMDIYRHVVARAR